MRKKYLALAATLVALGGSAAAQETIKLGLVNIDGGAFSIIAGKVNDAANFAVDTLNAQGGALGRKYELVTQMHAGTPAAAIAAASKLVEQQGVSFFAGLNGSATSLAIASKMSGLNALFIDSTALTDDLTGKLCQPNYFRVSVNDSMTMNAMRPVVKASGAKTWNSFMVDYSAGHDYSKNINALIQEQGGSVQTTLFAPISSTDFGSYVSQLGAKPADGLVVFFPGAGAITLAKQQQQFGLFPKFKTVIAHNSFTNEAIIDAQGDTTLGVITSNSYHWALPGERNAAFVKGYEARFKRKPSYLDADIFISYFLVHSAIQKAKSSDVAAVRTALAGLKASTLVGDVEMRAADHQLQRPMVILQVAKTANGKADIALRSTEPTATITAPVNPECKM